MSKFEDDLARGCLPTGEPLECLYGMGWWTEIPEEKPAKLEAEIDQLTAHDATERQDDKSSNDTQTDTVVYGKWIPVSERLPELDQDVLAIVEGDIVTGHFYQQWDGEIYFSSDDEGAMMVATHWMPLPPEVQGDRY